MPKEMPQVKDMLEIPGVSRVSIQSAGGTNLQLCWGQKQIDTKTSEERWEKLPTGRTSGPDSGTRLYSP